MPTVVHQSSARSGCTNSYSTERIVFSILVLVIPLLLTTACGKFFPDPDTLVGISVTPATSSIELSATQQYMAIGAFGDGTSRDVTSSVNWSSSSTNVATINTSGLATGAATGVSTITASQNGLTGSASLTVIIGNGGNGLTISCSGCTSQGSGTFTASLSSNLVNFSASSNGSTVAASWTSSNTNVATIGPGTGIAQLIATGTTTISASSNGSSGSITLTVQ